MSSRQSVRDPGRCFQAEIWSMLLRHGLFERNTEQELVCAKASRETALEANFCGRYLHFHSYDPLHLISPPRFFRDAVPRLPLEILLMIARLLTENEGKLCFADFNSFLNQPHTLRLSQSHSLARARGVQVHHPPRIQSLNPHQRPCAPQVFFLELGADIETVLLDSIVDSGFRDSDPTPLRVAAGLDNVPVARACLIRTRRRLSPIRPSHTQHS
jgi:hypothetical protein